MPPSAWSSATIDASTPSSSSFSSSSPLSTPPLSSSSSSSSPLCLPPVIDCMHHFTLHETRHRFYLVGSNLSRTVYRVLKIGRTSLSLDVSEDSTQYTKQEMLSLLDTIHHSNAHHGGIISSIECHACLGFTRFLLGFYLLIVSASAPVGRIGSAHHVHTVQDTTLIPLPHSSVYEMPAHAAAYRLHRNNEQKYRDLFLLLDLNRFFFYSFTYPLSRTLQANMIAASQGCLAPARDMYQWNHALLLPQIAAEVARDAAAMVQRASATTPAASSSNANASVSSTPSAGLSISSAFAALRSGRAFSSFSSSSGSSSSSSSSSSPSANTSSLDDATATLDPAAALSMFDGISSEWFVNLVHGSFEQKTLSILGRQITLTLIARRSRLFAGTRYLKRGVDDEGHAANDVETEQIVHDRTRDDAKDGLFVSHVSMRGSIPLFWTQEGNAMVAQPAITIQRPDPLHGATRSHLQQLWRRYNSPLLVLNLVKQHERRKRECIIGSAWGHALQSLNAFIDPAHRVDYKAFDYKKMASNKDVSVMDELTIIAQWTLQRTGLFHSRAVPEMQPCLALRTLAVRPQRDILQLWGLPGLPVQRAGLETAGSAAMEEEPSSAALETLSARSAHSPMPPYSPRYFDSSLLEGADEALQRQQHEFDRSGSWRSGGSSTEPDTPFSAPFHGHGFETPLGHDAMSASIRSLLPHASAVPPPAFASSSSPSSSSVHSSTSIEQHQHSPAFEIASIQRGVCRVNCVDSLDRTNVAAYCLGRGALGYQLYALALVDTPLIDQAVDRTSAITLILLEMYERMGDAISLQYGGSLAHRQVKRDSSSAMTDKESMSDAVAASSDHGKIAVSSSFALMASSRVSSSSANSMLSAFKPSSKQPKELLVSLMRHYQNSFQDNAKQDSINLFLGLFRPWRVLDGGSHLWEMASDFYLHNPPTLELHDSDGASCDNQAEALSSPLSDARWWQTPILEHEHTLGAFALPASQLFSAPAAARHRQLLSFGSPIENGIDSLLNARKMRGRSSSLPLGRLFFIASTPPSSVLTGSSSNLLSSHSSETLYSTSSLISNTSDLSEPPSNPELNFLSAYGPATVLSEFDTLIRASHSSFTHEINILGQAEPQKESSNRVSGKRRTAADAAMDSEEDKNQLQWQNERLQVQLQEELQRLSLVYAMDSAYSYATPRPQIAPSTLAQYSSYVSISPSELLVPTESAFDSERLSHAPLRIDAVLSSTAPASLSQFAASRLTPKQRIRAKVAPLDAHEFTYLRSLNSFDRVPSPLPKNGIKAIASHVGSSLLPISLLSDRNAKRDAKLHSSDSLALDGEKTSPTLDPRNSLPEGDREKELMDALSAFQRPRYEFYREAAANLRSLNITSVDNASVLTLQNHENAMHNYESYVARHSNLRPL